MDAERLMGVPDATSFLWPPCVSEYMSHRDLVDADYFIAGAARALTWTRVAASILNNLGSNSHVAEYHAYVGVSACRTSSDALGNWMKAHFGLGLQPMQIDFKKKKFRDALSHSAPSLTSLATSVAALLEAVDEFRQRAQHREGLALTFYAQQDGGLLGGWYLTRGLQSPRLQDQYLPRLLSDWADQIEAAICCALRSVRQ